MRSIWSAGGSPLPSAMIRPLTNSSSQERASSRVGQRLQRSHAAVLPAPDADVVAAARQHAQFVGAILIENDGHAVVGNKVLFQQRVEQADRGGFAVAGRADADRMPDAAGSAATKSWAVLPCVTRRIVGRPQCGSLVAAGNPHSEEKLQKLIA